MLFSPYRSSRVVAKGFLKEYIGPFRAFSEVHVNRPWASGMFGLAHDNKSILFLVPFAYGVYRWWTGRYMTDYYNASIMQKWGPSKAEVGKVLSAKDQMRARVWAEITNASQRGGSQLQGYVCPAAQLPASHGQPLVAPSPSSTDAVRCACEGLF
jgi:hypothetical protein